MLNPIVRWLIVWPVSLVVRIAWGVVMMIAVTALKAAVDLAVLGAVIAFLFMQNGSEIPGAGR